MCNCVYVCVRVCMNVICIHVCLYVSLYTIHIIIVNILIAYLGSWERDPITGKVYLLHENLHENLNERNSTDHRSNQEICRNHGGHLPEPRSREDNEDLRQFIESSVGHIRLGLTRQNPSGSWRWEHHRTDVMWTNWDPGQANRATKNCSVIGYDGFWTAVTCGESTFVQGPVLCIGICFSFSFNFFFFNHREKIFFF